ncbi:MAG: YicC/YloC family endoribonuclease [Pseudomonadota bacterium]|nr:YicC/YloC family endoribonuclease [Pseudomonadota bacterium]
MTVSSMTGFARAEGVHEGRRWSWEVKSVNGRGLETRFRLPPGLDHIEPDLRKAAAERLSRGSLNALLSLDKPAAAGLPRVNEAALEEVLKLIEMIGARIETDRPRAEGVLAVRGVMEQDDGEENEEARAALGKALVAGFAGTLDRLAQARRDEGAKLKAVLAAQIDEIERLSALARAHAETSPAAIRDRVAAQLKELLAGAALPEERLAQEAALLAVKADVREELDRLAAHAEQARTLLASPEPVGRRLDFLTQEFNREANTLCSKAQDMALKRLGLDLKTVIDQLREQVQNVE